MAVWGRHNNTIATTIGIAMKLLHSFRHCCTSRTSQQSSRSSTTLANRLVSVEKDSVARLFQMYVCNMAQLCLHYVSVQAFNLASKATKICWKLSCQRQSCAVGLENINLHSHLRFKLLPSSLFILSKNQQIKRHFCPCILPPFAAGETQVPSSG